MVRSRLYLRSGRTRVLPPSERLDYLMRFHLFKLEWDRLEPLRASFVFVSVKCRNRLFFFKRSRLTAEALVCTGKRRRSRGSFVHEWNGSERGSLRESYRIVIGPFFLVKSLPPSPLLWYCSHPALLKVSTRNWCFYRNLPVNVIQLMAAVPIR